MSRHKALWRKGNLMNDLIERYLAAWNETDPGKRRALIDDLFAEDASYIDPVAEAHGRNAIDATVAAVQAQFPGWTFTRAGDVDTHHRQARFTWALGPEGEAAVIGFDIAIVDEDGRLTNVFGFLDKVPG
jgi:hypothetical protein